MFRWSERECRKYQSRMEDCLGAGPQALESDPELSAHLRTCGNCREALAAAEMSGRLLACVEQPDLQPSEAFVTRVMASVRAAEAVQQAAVWRPLEVMASRFALVASVALLALSVFLGEFSPALRQPAVVVTGSVTNGTEITNDWPEPPASPATKDEVLMSLVEVDNGI
jgi:predicted anti-sigma-YlaC factor YlaD